MPAHPDDPTDPELSVIIPTRNSCSDIRTTLDVVRDAWPDLEILVVTDTQSPGDAARHASHYRLCTDARVQVVDALGAKAAAVQAGFDSARGRVVAYVDADYGLEATAGCLHRAVQLVADGVADCVAAERDQHDWSRIRKLKTRGFIWLTHLLFPRLPVRDTQAPLKVMTADAARHLLQTAAWRSWAFDVELLHRLQQADYRIRAYPVRWNGQGGELPWATAFLLAYMAPGMITGLARIRLSTFARTGRKRHRLETRRK
ncbi:glycosyltransferase [Actinomadura harenae]|nr:glycosyltransferase [Actinomadura harenae]